MPKLEISWQNLPFVFKSSVVEKLDYIDRCSLRKCSHSDRHLVDKTPNILDVVAVNVCENYSVFAFADRPDTIITVKYFKNIGENDLRIDFYVSPRVYLPGKNKKLLYKKTKILDGVALDADDLDFALIDFSIASKKLICNKSIINGVIIPDYCPMADPCRTMEFRERLLNLMKSFADQRSVIKSENLYLKWHQDTEEVVEILKVFDKKILKNLHFSDRNATWNMSKIMETEQWRRATAVHLELLPENLKMENLAHFREIQMHVRDIEERELWKLIQNFIRKNEHGASFHFTYRQAEPNLQRILDTFDVPIKDEPIRAQTRLRSVLGSRFVHTQRFQMPFGNLVLVVMISEKEVMGTVCSADQVDVEAKIERGLLR